MVAGVAFVFAAGETVALHAKPKESSTSRDMGPGILTMDTLLNLPLPQSLSIIPIDKGMESMRPTANVLEKDH